MTIGLQSCSIKPSTKIVEPEINREASQYIVENYRKLLGIVKSYDIKEDKAEDLLQDLFISIVDSEDNGEGFDMEYSNGDKEDTQILSVEQFVLGRAKLYSKNFKYRSDIVEGYASYTTETNVYYDSILDENGQEVIDRKGNVKKVKKVEKVKKPILFTINAASFDESNSSEDTNDDFQKAYALAYTTDSQDDVAELLSLRENIDYCIDICEINGINILNIFKNMDRIADMLGDFSKKKKSSDSVFSKLSELVEYHDDFGRTLMEILKFSSSNRAQFDSIVASYC